MEQQQAEELAKFKVQTIKRIKAAAQWNDDKQLVALLGEYESLIYRFRIKPIEEKLTFNMEMASGANQMLKIYRRWFAEMSEFVGSVRIAQTWKSKPFKEFVTKRLKKFDVATFDGHLERENLENDSKQLDCN